MEILQREGRIVWDTTEDISIIEKIYNTDPTDDSFKEIFDSFVEEECVTVNKHLPVCAYCDNSLLNQHGELEYLLVDSEDIDGQYFCNQQCLIDHVRKEMAMHNFIKNPKLDIDYITIFDSTGAKAILNRFTKEELLNFAKNDIRTGLFDADGWEKDYLTEDEITKDMLIDEIIEAYWC